LPKKILWLAYFDCRLSRSKGRRVSRDLCIDVPSIRDLMEACKFLGLLCNVNEEARYPRVWWYSKGYVIVDSEMSKGELIRKMARTIFEIHKRQSAG